MRKSLIQFLLMAVLSAYTAVAWSQTTVRGQLVDAETGEVIWVDTSSAAVRKTYNQWWSDAQNSLATAFAKARVDWVSVATNEDYVKPLIELFKHR